MIHRHCHLVSLLRLVVVIVFAFASSGCNLVHSGFPFWQSGLNPDKYFTGRQLAIARAIQINDLAKVRALAQGADLARPGKKDLTLMWFAASNPIGPKYKYAGVTQLMKLGVNMQTDPDQLNGMLNLIFITRSDPNDTRNVDWLAAMLDGGLPVNLTDDEGITLLERAAGVGGSVALIKMLIQRGAKINTRDSLGYSPLQEALFSNNLDAASYLLEKGASPVVPNIYGSTPARSLYLDLQRIPEGKFRDHLLAIKKVMIRNGAKWPPVTPQEMRKRMPAMGLKPFVPGADDQ